jgi:hypothetical protein
MGDRKTAVVIKIITEGNIMGGITVDDGIYHLNVYSSFKYRYSAAGGIGRGIVPYRSIDNPPITLGSDKPEVTKREKVKRV